MREQEKKFKLSDEEKAKLNPNNDPDFDMEKAVRKAENDLYLKGEKEEFERRKREFDARENKGKKEEEPLSRDEHDKQKEANKEALIKQKKYYSHQFHLNRDDEAEKA